MERELIELSQRLSVLEKVVEDIYKRKVHCDTSRNKIYDRLAILDQEKVRNEEKFKVVFEKLDVIIQTLNKIAESKNKIIYDIIKIVSGTAIGFLINWLMSGRLN